MEIKEFKRVFEDKTVLITGANGFLGKTTVMLLKEYNDAANANIKFLTPSRLLIENYSEGLSLDLRDRSSTKAYFAAMNPDIVFHIAARVGGLGYIGKDPFAIFLENLQITCNILEMCNAHDVEKLVIAGSACAYPPIDGRKMKESEFLSGAMHESVEMYGFSKRALYMGTKAFKDLDASFLILTNLYGPFDKFGEESHVVAALIKKFVDAKRDNDSEIVNWGTGKPVREFLFSRDAAEALIAAAIYNTPIYNPINIGNGIGTTIKELSNILTELVKYEGEVIWDETKPDGAMYKVLDVDHAKDILGWEVTTSLRKGLRETIKWYECNWKDGMK